MRHADGVGALREQVHHRRAAQPQIVHRRRLQQARGIGIGAQPADRQMQRELPRRTQIGAQRGQVDIDEIEFFGKDEVFGQQPISRMRAGRKIDQGIVLGKTDLRQRNRGQAVPSPRLQLDICRRRAQEQRIAQRRHE
ncbi:hypothetical protein G6F59_015409 [Rhizopus arrhizus]|nr:hypothetical protein G6F59_015409 [Rhizopus arrhizus]